MGKAILVIETPDKCLDCDLRVLDMDGSISCYYNKKEICNNVGENNSRPNWCPLKELPSKKKWGEIYNGNVKGWNDCLREIIGESKNE